jgi:Tfp pilus assembly protein PilO
MEATMEIKNRQQKLVVVTLVVLALYIGDLLVFEPMKNWWKAREANIVALRQQVSQGRTLVRRESVIRDEWQRIRTNSLPNDSSHAEEQVLKAFDNWAGSSGVNITSITPQWQSDQDDYSTLECRVEASGDLGTLSRFLYEIENDPMALQLESIELTASDDKGQQLTLGLQIGGLALVSQQP